MLLMQVLDLRSDLLVYNINDGTSCLYLLNHLQFMITAGIIFGFIMLSRGWVTGTPARKKGEVSWFSVLGK